MRTKIGLLAILTAVLLAFGGTAVAQDYGTETDPQDTTNLQEPIDQEPMERDNLERDVDVDAELNVQDDDEFADDQFADDDELPRTASFLPALGALGLLSLAGGAALRGRKS